MLVALFLVFVFIDLFILIVGVSRAKTESWLPNLSENGRG